MARQERGVSRPGIEQIHLSHSVTAEGAARVHWPAGVTTDIIFYLYSYYESVDITDDLRDREVVFNFP